MTHAVPLLNLIGPVGIGKSTTAEAVSQELSSVGVAHAIVDLDSVRTAYPAPPDDPVNMALGFRNLAAVWANYRAAGATCLIIPSVMESAADFAALAAAVEGAVLFVVRLTAPLAVTHARIRGRETTASGLRWHLARAAQLERELSEKHLEDLTVDTADRTPADVAAQIVAAWAERSPSVAQGAALPRSRPPVADR